MLNAQTLATYSFGLNVLEFPRFLKLFRITANACYIINMSHQHLRWGLCRRLSTKVRYYFDWAKRNCKVFSSSHQFVVGRTIALLSHNGWWQPYSGRKRHTIRACRGDYCNKCNTPFVTSVTHPVWHMLHKACYECYTVGNCSWIPRTDVKAEWRLSKKIGNKKVKNKVISFVFS